MFQTTKLAVFSEKEVYVLKRQAPYMGSVFFYTTICSGFSQKKRLFIMRNAKKTVIFQTIYIKIVLFLSDLV